jgi:hypothetical protein
MRCVRDVGVLVTLGPDYSWLEVQVEGDADKRHPASVKCTSINPAAKRHLRHVTPGSSSSSTRLRKFSCDELLPAEPPAAAAADGGEQQLLALALEGAGSGAAVPAGAHTAVTAADAPHTDADLADGMQQQQEGDETTAESVHSSSRSRLQQAQEGPSVSPADAAADGATSAADAHPTTSSTSSSSSSSAGAAGFPLSILQLQSGGLDAVHTISFLQPDELTGQQGGQQGAALLPQKGEGPTWCWYLVR